MDALAPWPALVRRLRFLSSLKQYELAQQLGVDQATVSRWERGTFVPDISIQKRIRDMLRQLEPAVDRAFVEQAPCLMAVSHIDNAGHVECVSQSVAITYHSDPAAMRNVEIYRYATLSSLGVLHGLNAHEGWCKGEVAWCKCVMQRCDGTWAQFSAAPIGQSGLCICIGSLVTPPEAVLKDGFQLIVTPFDEMVS